MTGSQDRRGVGKHVTWMRRTVCKARSCVRARVHECNSECRQHDHTWGPVGGRGAGPDPAHRGSEEQLGTQDQVSGLLGHPNLSRPLQGGADRSTHNPGHGGPQAQDSADSSKERRPGGCGAGGGPPSLLMVSGMLWTVWSLTHEFVSICSSTDVSEKLLKPEMGAQGRQLVSPPGSSEPPGPPGAFSPAILAGGPQNTPVRRPTGSTCSQGGAAKGQVGRGPGGLGWAEAGRESLQDAHKHRVACHLSWALWQL